MLTLPASLQQYAGNMQQGPGIMMPLAVKYMEALSGNTESLQILDIAGGTGIPSITVAKEHPEIFVTVTDLAPGMVAMAQAMAQAQGVSNVRCCPTMATCMSFRVASK